MKIKTIITIDSKIYESITEMTEEEQDEVMEEITGEENVEFDFESFAEHFSTLISGASYLRFPLGENDNLILPEGVIQRATFRLKVLDGEEF